MDWKFWIRRFLLVYGTALVVIAAGQLSRGRPAALAVEHGLLWALISAGIYVATLAYRTRRGCATCADSD